MTYSKRKDLRSHTGRHTLLSVFGYLLLCNKFPQKCSGFKLHRFIISRVLYRSRIWTGCSRLKMSLLHVLWGFREGGNLEDSVAGQNCLGYSHVWGLSWVPLYSLFGFHMAWWLGSKRTSKDEQVEVISAFMT